MSMKSLSTLGIAEEAPGGLSCLMDRVGGRGRGREGRKCRLLEFERSRPDIHLSTTATGQCGFPLLIKFKQGCFELGKLLRMWLQCHNALYLIYKMKLNYN